MFARIGFGISNMLGKPCQAAFCRRCVKFTIKLLRQSMVKFERALFAGRIGNVMNHIALFIKNIQAAQMVDGRHGGQIILEAHDCPF
jgi:hypothetical protein